MIQKIIQIGNSIGVIIPQTLAKNSLKPGDTVYIDKDQSSNMFIINKDKKNFSSITPHFLSVLDRVNKQYSKTFKELARR